MGPHVCISEGDILRHAPPAGSTVVSNVPFSLTTPVLRHLLSSPDWVRAVLLVQWEVAEKRAGVGGTTQLTAQWWPWISFTLDRRVPASAFRPRPSVDGGIWCVDRREHPLLTTQQQGQLPGLGGQVFTGGGSGLPDILARTGGMTRAQASQFCRDQGLDPRALPRDLTVQHWVAAFVGSRASWSGWAAVGHASAFSVTSTSRSVSPNRRSTSSRGSGVGSTRPVSRSRNGASRGSSSTASIPLRSPPATSASSSAAAGLRTAYAASAAAAYARSAWFARRRAKRCCDQPPALVRPWT